MTDLTLIPYAPWDVIRMRVLLFLGSRPQAKVYSPESILQNSILMPRVAGDDVGSLLAPPMILSGVLKNGISDLMGPILQASDPYGSAVNTTLSDMIDKVTKLTIFVMEQANVEQEQDKAERKDLYDVLPPNLRVMFESFYGVSASVLAMAAFIKENAEAKGTSGPLSHAILDFKDIDALYANDGRENLISKLSSLFPGTDIWRDASVDSGPFFTRPYPSFIRKASLMTYKRSGEGADDLLKHLMGTADNEQGSMSNRWLLRLMLWTITLTDLPRATALHDLLKTDGDTSNKWPRDYRAYMGLKRRIEIITSIQLYMYLSPLIALVQAFYGASFKSELLMTTLKAYPDMNSKFLGMDENIRKFMALPVASSMSVFVGDWPNTTSLKISGISMPAMMFPVGLNRINKENKSSVQANFMSQVFSVIQWACSLVDSPKIMELYMKGAAIIPSTNINHVIGSKSLDECPITVASWGHVAGAAVSSLDDISWNMILPRFINMRNGFTNAMIASNNLQSEQSDIIYPYHYGIADMAAKHGEWAKFLASIANKTVSVASLIEKNLPVFWTPFMLPRDGAAYFTLQPEFLSYGPTDLLPLPDAPGMPLVKVELIDTELKTIPLFIITGLRNDDIPVSYSAMTLKKKVGVTIFDSRLADFFNASREIVAMRAASIDDIGTSAVIKRFTTSDGQNIAAASLVKHPHFLMSTAGFFSYLPSYYDDNVIVIRLAEIKTTDGRDVTSQGLRFQAWRLPRRAMMATHALPTVPELLIGSERGALRPLFDLIPGLKNSTHYGSRADRTLGF